MWTFSTDRYMLRIQIRIQGSLSAYDRSTVDIEKISLVPYTRTFNRKLIPFFWIRINLVTPVHRRLRMCLRLTNSLATWLQQFKNFILFATTFPSSLPERTRPWQKLSQRLKEQPLRPGVVQPPPPPLKAKLQQPRLYRHVRNFRN